VLCDLFKTKAGRVIAGLLAEGWTPARFTTAPTTRLQAIFAARGCRLTRPLASHLRARAAGALPAHPAATAGKAAALAGMLGVLDGIDAEVERLEARMVPLLAATEGAKLTQIRGVGVVTASGFVAFVGRTDRWAGWSKVWRAAGLDPARSQSGAKDARLGISREGSAWGRRALLDLAAAVCRQPGRWGDGFRARTTQGRKPAKVALVATGNSIGRTCFALMRSGADFDPAWETKRTRSSKVGDQAA
jgi:transposase